jgi:hypothetical protein
VSRKPGVRSGLRAWRPAVVSSAGAGDGGWVGLRRTVPVSMRVILNLRGGGGGDVFLVFLASCLNQVVVVGWYACNDMHTT